MTYDIDGFRLFEMKMRATTDDPFDRSVLIIER